MKRIDDHTIEYESDAELVVKEIHDLLLDQGHSPGEALIILRGSRVPAGLRSETPTLDRVLTPEFVTWLTG